MRDWQATLAAMADAPETRLVLGGIGLTMRRMATTLQVFGGAVTRADNAVAKNPDSIEPGRLRADLFWPERYLSEPVDNARDRT